MTNSYKLHGLNIWDDDTASMTNDGNNTLMM